MAPVRDPNTLSNHLVFETTHTDVALALSFATSSLAGEVTLTMKALEDTLEDVILDTSYLDVQTVEVNGKVVSSKLAERMEPYGSALTVEVGREVKQGEDLKVKVCFFLPESLRGFNSNIIFGGFAEAGDRLNIARPTNARRSSG